MKNKKSLFLIFSILIIFSWNVFATTKLTTIGRYTFARVRGRIPTQEVMKMLIDRYAADIKYGFELAGNGDLYLPFLDQLKAATFEERALPVGDKFIWMLFRSQGKVKVARDIEWAGKAPLEVFVFNVKKDYNNYEFIMPRPCGNIALRSITPLPKPEAICAIKVTPAKVNLKDPVTVDMSGSQNAKSMEVTVLGPDGAKVGSHTFTPESPRWQVNFDRPGNYTFQGQAINEDGKASTNPCQAKVYVNAPPTCQLTTTCVLCKNFVGKPVTIDASGATDADGKVVKADFSITDAAGNPVDKFLDSEPPLTWDYIFAKPGSYTITAVVTDDFGAVSEPCRVSIEVTQKLNYFSVEGGPFFARGSHGPYLYAALDWFRWLKPDVVDFTLAGGGALAFKGDPWKSILLADATVNYHVQSFFFGGGVGFTTAVKEGRSADFELIGKLGFDLFKNPDQMGGLLFQVRWPVGEGRSFADHHKYVLGFRFLF